MTITSYQQAVRYLESFIGKVIFKVDKEFLKEHDPLERMRIFLSLLGNPQEKFKSVLVGGTSGKGSTAYLISHILTSHGYKTGFTLSPHLEKVNERLQINGKEISDKEFVRLLNSVKPAIEKMEGAPARHRLAKASAGGPSYFEILVGMAFTYFAKEKVDIAVVEVGMGGEFDATNTLNPLVGVLTNVSLDHTNVLGKSVEKIARTKAGIIKGTRVALPKRGSPHQNLVVVSGVKQSSVIKIVEDRCKKVGAELFRLHKDFNYKIKKESTKGSVFDLTISHDRVHSLNDLPRTQMPCSSERGFMKKREAKFSNVRGLHLSLIGKYQVENASLAIETVLQLRKFGFKVSENAIRKALKTAFFPGRFEILRLASLTQDKTSSTLVLDSAHNPTKMKEFLKSLKKIFPNKRKIFIIGFKFDKDIKKMLKQIVKVADEIIVTEFKAKTDTKIHAFADAFNIKNQILKIKKDMKVTIEKDSANALKISIRMKPELIVVTGSLYLVGEVRSML